MNRVGNEQVHGRLPRGVRKALRHAAEIARQRDQVGASRLRGPPDMMSASEGVMEKLMW